MRQVSQPRTAPRPGLALLAASPRPPGPGPPTAEMKPYTETIAGTELKFDMVPIPGGNFTMGSPAGEAEAARATKGRSKVEIAPFWMGKCEVTWDEFDDRLQQRHPAQAARGRRPHQAARDRDGRPTPSPGRPSRMPT